MGTYLHIQSQVLKMVNASTCDDECKYLRFFTFISVFWYVSLQMLDETYIIIDSIFSWLVLIRT